MVGTDNETDVTTQRARWWEHGWFMVALVVAAAVPLLWPALPPLGDLPGHMGRWHIAMALGDSPDLTRYYTFHWALIPNLGMDLVVPALARIFGFEPATKLAVIAIPVVTVIGLLWTAREAHGRVPPTAILVVPLVYAWPFQFGFVNFALSQALAFCALAVWIRWGREGRFAVRAVAFVAIAPVLWVAHSFGWGMFGLMAAAAELARLRAAGRGWGAALGGTIVQCLPLAGPLGIMAFQAGLGSGHGEAGLGASDWFNMPAKVGWILSIFRDRWQAFDLLSLIPPVLVLYAAARSRDWRFSRILGWPALACLAAFALLPRLLMGGAYVDMRIAPAMVMLALIAIAPPVTGKTTRTTAWLAVLFVVVRLGGTTLSFVERSAEQQSELSAIAAIPRGAAVLSLVARPCFGAWTDLRRDHLPGLAIVRRDVFTNVQWVIEGQQLLSIRHQAAAPYLADPSQSVFPAQCSDIGSNFSAAIAGFPRAAFTHVWTIGYPPGAAQAADLRVVWTNGTSTLYRVAGRRVVR
jgi:hypothetical protein